MISAIVPIILLTIFREPFVREFSPTNETGLAELKGIATPEDILVENDMIIVSNRGSDIIRVYDSGSHKIIKNISLTSLGPLFTPSMISLDPKRSILYVGENTAFSPEDVMLAGINIENNNITSKFLLKDFASYSNSSNIEDMLFNSGSDTLFLTNKDGLFEVDGETQQVQYSEFEGVNPSKITLDPRSNFLYAINNNTVTVIDSENDKIISPSVEIGSFPTSITMDSVNELVYVINKDANRVSIINTTTYSGEEMLYLTTNSSILSNDEVTRDPDILFSPNANKIYISNYNENSVIVIDAKTRREIKTIPTDRPEELEINEKNNFLYVKSGLSDTISVIDGNKDVLVMGRIPYLEEAGIKVSENPEDTIAVNSRTNLVYVGGGSTISVIDGKNDKLLTTIALENNPVGLAVNELTNKIYADNCLDDSVTVIDGFTNRIENQSILVPNLGCAIVADRESDAVFFLSSNHSMGYTLNILNSTGHIGEIPIPYDGMDFDFELSSLTIFIASGLGGNYAYAFDPSTIRWEQILVGEYPRHVIYNPNNALAYVVNQNSHTVSVIDKYSHDVIKEIPVGTFPSDIALNIKTNTLYVANEHSDTISVINGTSDTVLDSIQVGNFPMGVVVNPTTNTIYVTNDDSDTISVIDGNTRKTLVGVNFNLNPINSGELLCNGKKIVNATYIRYTSGTTIECKAIPNKGFTAGSWSGNVLPVMMPAPSDTVGLTLDRFGNLTANFERSTVVDLNIPFDTLLQILLIVVTAVIGWSIPGIAAFLSKLRQKNIVIDYMNSINTASQGDDLEMLRKQISGEYARGKINSTNYDILNNRVKERYDVLEKRE